LRQMSGICSVVSRMNRTGVGGRGVLRSFMLVSSSRRSPLRWLHGAQDVTTFSHTDVPPRERGTTWSSVRRLLSDPQYTHCQPSRAKRTLLEIRLVTARGTRTYVRSRITFGRWKLVVAERSGRSWHSRISALPFQTRTCARRSEQTFRGS